MSEHRPTSDDSSWAATIADMVRAIDSGKIRDVASLVVSEREWAQLAAAERAAHAAWASRLGVAILRDPALEPGLARVLRREPADSPPADADRGADIVTPRGRIPHGSQLRALYKGLEHRAEVRDGRVLWDGRWYDSLSTAAVAVIQRSGTLRLTENGWRFWEVKTPGSAVWLPASALQQRSGPAGDPE